MKTKVETEGMVVTNRKDIAEFFKAMELTGLEINYTKISKATGISVATVFDIWNRIKNHNEITIEVKIKGNTIYEKVLCSCCNIKRYKKDYNFKKKMCNVCVKRMKR